MQPVPQSTLDRYYTLLNELNQERESFLRGTPRASYLLDDGLGNVEAVPRVDWVTVMTDRCNQLALACQLEGQDVQIVVPPGSILDV